MHLLARPVTTHPPLTHLSLTLSPTHSHTVNDMTQAAARAGAAAGGAAILNATGAPTSSSSSLGNSASIFNVYGIADCGARTELTVTELYDQLRLLVLVTNDTLRFMESMCSATEFEAIFGF